MGQLELGLYDVFTHAAMATAPTAADVYDEHIRCAQEAEQLGYKYYFSIEHQTSPISYLSAPNVYLTALARHTSVIRFGVMIYQLPFHHPIRLAQDAAMLDHLSRGRLEFGAGTGVSPHEFMRWNVPFEPRREMIDLLPALKDGDSKQPFRLPGLRPESKDCARPPNDSS